MVDPTAEEMREHLASLASQLDADAFDIEEAIYWFANDWHGGQDSNLYSALSTSRYNPGPISRGIEPDSIASMLYAELEATFA